MASYKDYISMDPKTLMSMSKKDLAKVVTIMDSAANKRLKRLRTEGFGDSQAINRHKASFSSEGKFSVKGLTLQELRKQFIQVKQFLQSKSSDVRGARKIEKELKNRLGIKGTLDSDTKNKLWSAYNHFVEKYGGDPSTKQKAYDSNQIQKDIVDMVNNDIDDDEIQQVLDDFMREKYERETEEEQQTEFNLRGTGSPII